MAQSSATLVAAVCRCGGREGQLIFIPIDPTL
jgi:hypothetical protein